MVYTMESSPMGGQLCRLTEFAKDISVGVSVFTLTALSAERYCAIVNPLRKLHVSSHTSYNHWCTRPEAETRWEAEKGFANRKNSLWFADKTVDCVYSNHDLGPRCYLRAACGYTGGRTITHSGRKCNNHRLFSLWPRDGPLHTCFSQVSWRTPFWVILLKKWSKKIHDPTLRIRSWHSLWQ